MCATSSQRGKVGKKVRVTLRDMLSVMDSDRLEAAQTCDGQRLDQTMIGVGLDRDAAPDRAWLNWLDLDGIGQGRDVTAEPVQFIGQVLNTIALLEMQIGNIEDAAGCACETGRGGDNRHAIDHAIAIQADSL